MYNTSSNSVVVHGESKHIHMYIPQVLCVDVNSIVVAYQRSGRCGVCDVYI